VECLKKKGSKEEDDDTDAKSTILPQLGPSGSLYVKPANGSGFEIWDLRTLTVRGRLTWPTATSDDLIAISPNWQLAAVRSGEVIRIRGLETGSHIRELSARGYAATTAMLSADGQTLGLMKIKGDETKLVTIGLGAARPTFLTHKARENVYYLGLSTAQGMQSLWRREMIMRKRFMFSVLSTGARS
jgi:hypothetical protein